MNKIKIKFSLFNQKLLALLSFLFRFLQVDLLLILVKKMI